MTTQSFNHIHAAHCETGVVSSLFTNRGFELSEPMAFGIGSGLLFVHLPFYKVMDIPVTTYRTMPGSIFKRTCKRLGVSYVSKRFSSQEKSMSALNELVDQGIPVGLQTNIFWLTYFPKQFRFQFNGHNLIVKGREGDTYQISDPVVDTLQECDRADILRARFGKGPFAPRGLMYYPKSFSDKVDYRKAIYQGIKTTLNHMLRTPSRFVGVKGIRYLGGRVKIWSQGDLRKARLYLGQVVRMQEEIGTGGAGFRFMYGAFLQESANLLKEEFLNDASKKITDAGDCWRKFAVISARICKQDEALSEFDKASELLLECAEKEQIVFDLLKSKLHLISKSR